MISQSILLLSPIRITMAMELRSFGGLGISPSVDVLSILEYFACCDDKRLRRSSLFKNFLRVTAIPAKSCRMSGT